MAARPRHVGHWPSRVLKEKCPGFQRRRRACTDRQKCAGLVETLPGQVRASTASSGRSGRRRSGRPDGIPPGLSGGREPAELTRPARLRAAGTRLSRTRAVLPAPDGPDTAVSRCTGKRAVRSCKLYRLAISRASAEGPVPWAVRARPRRRPGQAVIERWIRSWPGCPRRSLCRLLRPHQGRLDDPVGTAVEPRSCSTVTTELPLAARAAMVLRSPTTLLGCSPTEGSSRTYSIPVVLSRTVEVSWMRCGSRVDREAPGR